VYRLLTIGTIEEKIYRRQIYKKGMSLATIDSNQTE
jgi:SNF2 family DNA or RNA helicase